MRRPPVLILGAGINGAALAREFVVYGVPVIVVDSSDLASGATSASSRLIHGGLRYLEYGEFDLVRESLEERTRLLRLAPHLVRPIELFVPLSNRFGGFFSAARRFFGTAAKPATHSRGLWLVRAGLRWYDAYARDPALPRHRVYHADDPQAMPVDAARYRWQCSYFDAQAPFPERVTISMLEDARRAAETTGATLTVFTYATARLAGRTVEVVSQDGEVQFLLEPAAILNATGAWVDSTLAQLAVRSERLIGGTKGTHFLSNHQGLRDALRDRGVYAEAADGRPVFILPLGEQTLVGTTDVPFEGDPRVARATDEELDYLLAAVNGVFGHLRLERTDIDWHYAGVRPLPFVDRRTPASITRRHWLHEHSGGPVPLYSVIGGKLTTCRSLAESTAATVLRRLGWPLKIVTRDRPLPTSGETLAESPATAADCLDGTNVGLRYVAWVIQHELVRTLADLVERRLMLLYQRRLTRRCLEQLAEQLVAAGLLTTSALESTVAQYSDHLRDRYGKQIQ